jgi:MFS family permease
MFPQLGAPIGFICSSSTFLLLTSGMTDKEFLVWGWRVPFLASALLVFMGLYVRLRLAETPAFQRAIDNNERVRVPMLSVLRNYGGTVILGTFATATTFVVFYLMTVFALSWGTTVLHFARPQFLIMQIVGVLFFAATIPVSAALADRIGRLEMLIAATVAIIAFGLMFAPLFGSGTSAGALTFLCLGFALVGLTYGPLGAALAELFETPVRYTGSSVTFNLAGIVGASLAPYIATSLAKTYGLSSVGYYLSGAGIVTLVTLIWIRARRGTARRRLALSES